MTQLLISVTSIEETRIALESGADIIDLKDPAAGALGALPMSLVKSVVSYVNTQPIADRRLTSATIGDLPMLPDLITGRVVQLFDTKVNFIKIGFFESTNYQPCLDALRNIAQSGVKLIAVLFAENTYPADLVEAIKEAGFIGVMLDTAKKNGLTFMDYYSEEQRKEFAQKVIENNLSFGLAGSLKLQHVVIAKEINPTYMGFRGGVCDANQRELALNAEKIRAIRKTL